MLHASVQYAVSNAKQLPPDTCLAVITPRQAWCTYQMDLDGAALRMRHLDKALQLIIASWR